MNQEEVLTHLERVGALIKQTHVVYTSGRHGDSYINKDALYPHSGLTSRVAEAIAKHFSKSRAEVVLSPAIGAVILGNWVSYHLGQLGGREVLSLYAEKSGEGFAVRRGYDKLLRGKRALIIEDVLTTGASARKVITLARSHDCDVLGVGVLCNRGGVTAASVGDVPELFSLIRLALVSWEKQNCPLCAKNVPINQNVGKGGTR